MMQKHCGEQRWVKSWLYVHDDHATQTQQITAAVDPQPLSTRKLMWEQMGKVQDTISKISERAGLPAPARDIALLVPAQRPATIGSFPTDAAAVGRYLDDLTTELKTTSSEAAIYELIRALQHSNRLANSPAIRLQIARLFEPAAQHALMDLNAGFNGVNLPYPARSVSDFEQATSLLQEMAACYKVVLLDVLRRRGQLARKHRLPVIYQAMKHLAECGLCFSLSYQIWPGKLWRDLNTLYLCAEREQGVDTVLSRGTNPQTIRQLYSQCCAFAACAGSHLSSFCLSQLYHQLGKHSDVVDLTDSANQHSNDSLYSVALDSAHPPCAARYSRYQKGQQVRFFDLEPVIGELTVTDPDELGTVAQSTTLEISERADASHLRNLLRYGAGRHHPRSVRKSELHTETGLKEIYASLLTARKSQQGLAAEMPTSRYGTQWIVQNRSPGGLGLKWTGKGNCHINVGELIAHYEHADQGDSNNPGWHIGIVRWIQSGGQDNLLCGVETLANYATAVTTSGANVHQPNPQLSLQSGTVEALLLNEHPAASRPPMLLVPTHHYRIGEKISILDTHSNRSVKLVENYPVGGNFHCFGFKAAVA